MDSVDATMELAPKLPFHLKGRVLHVKSAKRKQMINDPTYKLYFSGCAGDEPKIRTIFKQFGDSITQIYLCMLFTLSGSVLTTHME